MNRIYLIDPAIKDTTDMSMSVSYLDLHLEVDSDDGFRTRFTINNMYVATFQQHLYMEYIVLS